PDKGHAADGTGTRPILDDERVHRAEILGSLPLFGSGGRSGRRTVRGATGKEPGRQGDPRQNTDGACCLPLGHIFPCSSRFPVLIAAPDPVPAKRGTAGRSGRRRSAWRTGSKSGRRWPVI